jgi:uncharacterized membrane protein YfhO
MVLEKNLLDLNLDMPVVLDLWNLFQLKKLSQLTLPPLENGILMELFSDIEITPLDIKLVNSDTMIFIQLL